MGIAFDAAVTYRIKGQTKSELSVADGKVHVGQDGVLFLIGGAHGVLDYFTGALDPPDSSIGTFAGNLDFRKRFCSRRDIKTYTYVFADKLYALRQHLSLESDIRSLFLTHYAEVDKEGDAHYLLSSVEHDRAAFLDRDTHNSARGCRQLVADILRHAAPDRIDHFEHAMGSLSVAMRGYRGDLGRMLSDGATAQTEIFDFRNTGIVSAENGLVEGNDGLLILSENPDAPPGRLLIFGDSFFRQLVPYLSMAFGTVMFCRSRSFHAEMVDAFRPDTVLCGLAERYLSKCFPDQGRPHFLVYPVLKGRAQQPSELYCQLWRKHIDSQLLAATGRVAPSPATS